MDILRKMFGLFGVWCCVLDIESAPSFFNNDSPFVHLIFEKIKVTFEKLFKVTLQSLEVFLNGIFTEIKTINLKSKLNFRLWICIYSSDFGFLATHFNVLVTLRLKVYVFNLTSFTLLPTLVSLKNAFHFQFDSIWKLLAFQIQFCLLISVGILIDCFLLNS